MEIPVTIEIAPLRSIRTCARIPRIRFENFVMARPAILWTLPIGSSGAAKGGAAVTVGFRWAIASARC
jgi:hypothetical protein